MAKCKNCEYWFPLKDQPHRGVCTNPNRADRKRQYYYGSLKEDDYCTSFSGEEKEEENVSHAET
jgi:hypothetical protein